MTSSNPKDNPCLRKKGTLVITIEPCTKGAEPEKINFHFDKRLEDELPPKTPKTMAIEIQIKETGAEVQSSTPPEEIYEEREIAVHSMSKPKVSSPSEPVAKSKVAKPLSAAPTKARRSPPTSGVASEPEMGVSCRTIPLDRKPCSKSCPGPLICIQHRHFYGDNCQLHDPTAIGNQIMEMHKKGIIRKRPYKPVLDYPSDIMGTIAEINKLQTADKEARKNKSKSGGNSILSIYDSVDREDDDRSNVLPPDLIKKNVPGTSKAPSKPVETEEEARIRKNRSGCYC